MSHQSGLRVFLLLPRRINGRWKWLVYATRVWNWSLNDWGYGGYSGTDGGWEYHE